MGCQTPYRVRGCTFSCRHHFRFWGRISFGGPSSQIRAIGSPPFWSTLTPTAVEQDWADQGIVNGEFNFVWRERCTKWREKCSPKKHLFAVWIFRYIFRLASFVGVTRDPRYTNSLTTSKCLPPITTLCPTSRIVLSFRAAII
jgi:hypothetical protein